MSRRRKRTLTASALVQCGAFPEAKRPAAAIIQHDLTTAYDGLFMAVNQAAKSQWTPYEHSADIYIRTDSVNSRYYQCSHAWFDDENEELQGICEDCLKTLIRLQNKADKHKKNGILNRVEAKLTSLDKRLIEVGRGGFEGDEFYGECS